MESAQTIIYALPWFVGALGVICLACIAIGEIVAEIQWHKALANEMLDEVLKLYNQVKELEEAATRQPQHVSSISDLASVDLNQEVVSVIVDPSPAAELDGWITVHPQFDRKLKELDKWLDESPTEQVPSSDALVDLNTWQEEKFDTDVVEVEPEMAEGKVPEVVELNFNPQVKEVIKKKRSRRRKKRAKGNRQQAQARV